MDAGLTTRSAHWPAKWTQQHSEEASLSVTARLLAAGAHKAHAHKPLGRPAKPESGEWAVWGRFLARAVRPGEGRVTHRPAGPELRPAEGL